MGFINLVVQESSEVIDCQVNQLLEILNSIAGPLLVYDDDDDDLLKNSFIGQCWERDFNDLINYYYLADSVHKLVTLIIQFLSSNGGHYHHFLIIIIYAHSFICQYQVTDLGGSYYSFPTFVSFLQFTPLQPQEHLYFFNFYSAKYLRDGVFDSLVYSQRSKAEKLQLQHYCQQMMKKKSEKQESSIAKQN